MKEELQSANEELEAITQELRSLNEELATVNAQLREKVEQLALREHQQSVVARLGVLALKETDVQAFLDQMVRDVRDTLACDFCEVLEVQPGSTRLLLRAGVGWKPGLVGSGHVPSGRDSQAGYTLQSTEPVLVWDLAKEKRFSGPALLTEHGVASGLSCVIHDGDHEYGVLGAHTRAVRVFTREDAKFLQAVAGIAGSAIGRSQVRQRLALELGVAHALSRAANVDEALEGALTQLVDELGGSFGEVWWVTQEKRIARRAFHATPSTERAARDELFPGGSWDTPRDGLVAAVLREAQAKWWTDLGERPPILRQSAVGRLGLVSGFGLPIRGASEVLGVITVLSTRRMLGERCFLRSLETVGRSIGDFVVRSEFEQRAQRLAAITESSHDAILSYDGEGRITEWLAGAERLFGYTAEEMLGASIERIVPEPLQGEFWENNERIRAGEVVEPLETTRLCKDGRRVDVSVRRSPIKDRNGRVIGFSATDRDITRQKETERRLVEADRQKDEFLAMLGHELRNPLAAIRNAAQLIKILCAENPRLERAQVVLERQSTHMAKLLDGLLDVSRIIRGKIRLEKAVVDLVEICRDAVSDVRDQLEGRELEIRTEVPTEPIWLEADPVRLTQIVVNLLSNAVKYTPDGGTISVTLEQADGRATLTVRDTGVGIDPELLPHIFGVFRQSEQNLARSYGGLGLGLSLSRSLAELHGGTIQARSEGVDQGSAFVVELATTQRRPAPRRRQADLDNRALRILLIEDNDDAAEMLREVLQMDGFEVSVAGRGQLGVTMAKNLEPDVVLCDLGLPDGMSGYDVARKLRETDKTQGIRLVALSGYGRPEDVARGVEAGFDAHLTKPVDVTALHRLLAEIATGRREGGPRDASNS